MSILIIVSNFVMVSVLVYSITKSKNCATFLFAFLVMCLPFSFEHTIPNGFVAFFGMPFSLLVLSFISYINYLENEKNIYLIVTIVCLLIALFSYEVFIMYTPLYLVFTLWKKKNLKNIVQCIFYPTCTGIIYLIIYIVQGHIFPTNYKGNTLTFSSWKNSLEIIVNLFLSSLPGYYFTTNKYQYIYFEGKTLDGIKEHICYFVMEKMSFRLFMIILLIVFVVIYWGKCWDDATGRAYKYLGVVAFAYMFLPSIPVSLAEAYQGNVNENAFLALPVSYFIYISFCVFVTAMISMMVNLKKNTLIICVICGFLSLPNQVLGEQVLEIEEKNWNDYIFMEKMLGTETVKACIADKTIFSKEMNQMVAMRCVYLSQIADVLYNYNTEFLLDEKNAEIKIEWVNQEYFVVTDGRSHYVISNKPLSACYFENDAHEDVLVTDLEGYYDNGLIVYCLLI